MRMIHQLLSLSLVFVGLVISSCGKSGKHDTGDLSGSISIDGSSTVYPLTEAVAEEFRKLYPNVKTTIGVSGTGGGFKKFSRGETHISNASRPIKKKEAEACAAANIQFIELPVAYDGLAVVVGKENTWVDYMTVAELKKLWEPAAQGKIKKWNQIRSSWPDEEIHLFGAGTASGTFDYFTEAIVGEAGASRGDFTASEDDNVLVQGVSMDRLALGFFGLAYYEENTDKLKLVPISVDDSKNGSDAVVPTQETVANGTYQPLSRPVFIYVNLKECDRPEVQTFVSYYLEHIGSWAKDVGYVALPEDVYAAARKRFEKRTTGSMLEGIENHVGVRLIELMNKRTADK